MRLIFVPAWIASMLIVFVTSASFCQCPPSQKWMTDVVAIEQNDDEPPEKINSFTSLRKAYVRCQPKRDSMYARITHRMGDLYRIMGDFERGIALTREAISINKQNVPHTQPAFLAHSYYNLGLYFKLLNLTSESHRYFDSCIEVGNRYSQKAFIAQMAFEQKAFIYFKSGDYANSVFTADRGISALKNSDPVAHALLLLQRAQALLKLDRIDEAERDLNKSFEILKANGGEVFFANANSVQAAVLSWKKKYNEAVLRYMKAFEANRSAENWEQCARDQQDLGMLYDHGLKLSAAALNCYHKAISFTKITRDVYTRASLYANIGLVHARENKFPEALRNIQIALNTLPMQFADSVISKNPDTDQLKRLANDYVGLIILANKAEVLMDWYKLSGKREMLHQSLEVFLLVDFMIDQMRWSQSDGQSHLFWREKTRQWYKKALEICHIVGDTERAFYFMEKSRAVLLNDKINELNASSRLSPEDYKIDQQLRIRLVAAQQRMTEGGTKASVQDVFAAQQEQHAFISSLAKKYPLYYQYRYDRTVPDLQKFRSEYLGADKSLVSYFDADSVLYALVVRPDSVLFEKMNVPAFHQDASRFLSLLSTHSLMNSRFSEYRALATGLHRIMFEPFRIATKSVIVLHDQYFIPMDALISSRGEEPRYLVEDFNFSYAYSASFLSRVGRNNSASTRMLGIAPIRFRADLNQADLAGSDVSVERIAEQMSGVTLVLEGDATKMNFISQIPDYDVVHLFSHAEHDYKGEPVLFLHDSILKVSELQTLGKLNTSLISLFACHTGAGKSVTGEGTFSLARGFAAAGIPATVTSMWTLDNKAAYSMAELFYKHVHAGESTSRALQLAKIELLHSKDGEYALPFFWAGTILLGPSQNFGHDTADGYSPMNFILIVIGLSVLGIGIVFVVRRRNRSAPSS